jgi:amino acid adenylation domain-containing protein
VLGVDKNNIGIEDNFFERGGHSIRAAIVVSRIHKEFNVEFPLSNVFNGPTVKEFAAFINEAKKDIYQGIEPVPVMEYYLQSSAQKRLFFLDRFEDIGTSYNIPFVIEVEGKIDNERFEKTFNALIARHESLRTSFELIDDEAVQRVHEEENSKLQIINYKARRSTAHPPKITNVIKRFIRPFDLSQAPLLRVGLVKLAQENHLLLFDMHHIIADGTSMQVLVGDFTAFYSGETLPPLRIQYKDFSRWQNRLLQSPEMQAQEDYWLKVFDGEIPVLNLPTDFPRPQMQSFAGNRIAFQLEAEETGALKRLALEREVTLFMVLLALYTVLLSRLSGQEDIVVGVPTAGRWHADLEPIIGMFVNTLALRNFPAGGKRFKDFLKEVKARTLEAFDNQDYQFEDLVEKVPVPRDTGRNPLFDVMFALQNMETLAGNTPGLEIPGLELKPYGYENVTSKFDLNLQAAEVGAGLRFKLEYCTKLFSAATIRRLIRYFRRITESVIAAPGIRLADIEIMTEEEKRPLLEMSRGVREEVDETVTIHGWFAKKAEEVPDKTAVVLEDSYLTYHQLNRGANRLARTLRAGGVTSDSVVGLMVKRSLEMVTAVLAVMKAGGAYLPLDEEFPAERTRYMLRDSSVSLLLTNRDRQEVSPFVPGDTAVIDITGKGVYGTVAADPICAANGSNLAYALYTSGSTGKPKGLLLEHRNLVNLMNHHFWHTGIDCSRVLQFSTLSFDVSFHEMFSTLLAGGTLYLIARETRTHIPELFAMIERNHIKTLFLPISFLKMVFSEEVYAAAFPGCVSHIQSAGEQVVVTERFRSFLKKNNVCLHNHYGPAETHVVTTFTVDPAKDIPDLPPIGKPIRNTDIYILDKAKHLLPIGVPGELYIAGIQVGRVWDPYFLQNR